MTTTARRGMSNACTVSGKGLVAGCCLFMVLVTLSAAASKVGESLGDGVRVISTTNRNFEGRQGLRVKTHIASPLTTVASACAGYLTADTPL